MDASVHLSDVTHSMSGSDGLQAAMAKSDADAVELTAELYIRASVDPGTHDSTLGVLADLDRLVNRGVIDDYSTRLVGSKVCCCEACAETEPMGGHLAELRRWREWATGADVSIPLEECTVTSEFLDDSYTFLRPPTTTLVLRADGQICLVLPHHVEERSRTPSAYLEAVLEAFEDGDDGPNSEESARRTRVEAE